MKGSACHVQYTPSNPPLVFSTNPLECAPTIGLVPSVDPDPWTALLDLLWQSKRKGCLALWVGHDHGQAYSSHATLSHRGSQFVGPPPIGTPASEQTSKHALREVAPTGYTKNTPQVYRTAPMRLPCIELSRALAQGRPSS